MGYSAADTAQKHERILEEASRLFREKSFSRVSVSQVMQAAGLTHGPFYNHFSSKEELASESLRHCMQQGIADLEKCSPTRASKRRYIDQYLSEAHCHDRAHGCPVAALASEVGGEPGVQATFTAQLRQVLQTLASKFPWGAPRSSRGDAIHAYAATVGALILSRAVDDPKLATEILAETRKRIE